MILRKIKNNLIIVLIVFYGLIFFLGIKLIFDISLCILSFMFLIKITNKLFKKQLSENNLIDSFIYTFCTLNIGFFNLIIFNNTHNDIFLFLFLILIAQSFIYLNQLNIYYKTQEN